MTEPDFYLVALFFRRFGGFRKKFFILFPIVRIRGFSFIVYFFSMGAITFIFIIYYVFVCAAILLAAWATGRGLGHRCQVLTNDKGCNL